MHTHAGRGEKQEWVFIETISLLKCHNKKRAAVTNRASELWAAKPIQRMMFYQKGKAGQKEVMKQISIKEQKAGLSTEPEARLHQNLQIKCKTSDLAILLPRNYLPHYDQYYNTHRDEYFYLNLRLTQWELQTLSHTNSHTSRRVKMGKKELEAFQVLSPFSPFSLNHTKTIWGNSSDQNYLREQFRIDLCYPRPDQ